MKNIKYISILAVLVSGMTFTGCGESFLETENKKVGGTTAEEYFSNDPQALLTSAYYNMRNIAYSPELYCQGTDLYINTRGKSAGEFNEYSLTSENSTVKSFYSNLYKCINYANGAIKYDGESTSVSEEAKFIRCYCYYILTQHFGAVPYVTNYINDATTDYPRTDVATIYDALSTELGTLYAQSSLPQTSHTGTASMAAVCALNAKVKLAQAWDCDVTCTSETGGDFSVNSTTNFASAAEWAERAITTTGVTTLSMSFEDKWSPSNEGNAEEIFSIQYERDNYPGDVTSGGHSMQNNFGGYYGECTASGMKNVSSSDAQSEKSMYLFDEGDLRYDATFMTTMYNAGYAAGSTTTAAWGTDGYYAYYNRTASELASYPIAHRYFPWYYTESEVEAELTANKAQYVQGTNITEPTADILVYPNIIRYSFDSEGNFSKSTVAISTYNTQTSNGVCVKKFDDAASDQYGKSNDYRDIVLLHVSDIYLVAAEAYLMAGNKSAALTKLNAVRNRAGLASLSSIDGSSYDPSYTRSSSFVFKDIDVILDERARELYAEGYRWMDLRRTKQLIRYNVEFNDYVSTATDMANNAGEYKWYRPIPADEISTNTALTTDDQNPGY